MIIHIIDFCLSVHYEENIVHHLSFKFFKQLWYIDRCRFTTIYFSILLYLSLGWWTSNLFWVWWRFLRGVLPWWKCPHLLKCQCQPWPSWRRSFHQWSCPRLHQWSAPSWLCLQLRGRRPSCAQLQWRQWCHVWQSSYKGWKIIFSWEVSWWSCLEGVWCQFFPRGRWCSSGSRYRYFISIYITFNCFDLSL